MKVSRESALAAVLAAVAGLGGALLARAFDAAPASASAPEQEAAAQLLAPSAPEPSSALPTRLAAASKARVIINLVGRQRPARAELELLRHDALDGLLHLGRFTADEAGAVSFSLPAGQYTALAHAPGARGKVTFEAPGDRGLELFLELEPTRSARLRVVEKGSRRPLAGATAALSLADDERGPARAGAQRWTSDGLGRIDVTDLGPEVAVVRVEAPDHLPELVWLDPASDVEPEVALAPASYVTGLVRDENGTPLGQIRVSSDGDTETASAADGSYRLMAAAGTRTLAAVDPAGRAATRVVTVPEAATLPGVDFQLGVPLRLTGLVVDAQTEAPLAEVVVQALAFKGVAVARTTTDLLGRFELDGLPQGQVSVLATQGRGARAEQFGVETSRQEPLTLRLASAAALWGVVTDQAGNPVPGARVSAVWDSRDELQAVTDEAGTWRLDDVRAGSVDLKASVGRVAASTTDRVFLAPGLALRQDLVVQVMGTVEGTITGATTPPPWRVVARRRNPGPDSRTTLAGADGSFRFSLTPGEWNFGLITPSSFSFHERQTVMVEAGRTAHVDVDASALRTRAMHRTSSVTPGTLGAAFDGADGHVRFGFLVSTGPAVRAGVREGDELLAVDGRPITDTLAAYAQTQGAPGARLELELRTPAGTRTVAVHLAGGEEPPE